MNYFVSLGIRMHQGRKTQDAGHRMQDAEVTKLLSVFTLHVCTLFIR